MKRTPLKRKSKNPTAVAKDEIQGLLRAIAIKRDGGCVMRNYPETGLCGGHRTDGEIILQFDHLNTRARNISYGDVRLGICVCKRHHLYYKKQHPFEYERCAIGAIGKKRAELLYRVRADRKMYSMGLWEWQKIIIGLKRELEKLN